MLCDTQSHTMLYKLELINQIGKLYFELITKTDKGTCIVLKLSNMKVFKSISVNGSVSYSKSLRKALKSNPIIVLQERGLIVPRS